MKAIRYIYSTALLLATIVWNGCTEGEVLDSPNGREILFDNARALISRSTEVRSRAIANDDLANKEYQGLEATDSTIFLNGSKPWGDVKMYMTVDENNTGGVTDYTYGNSVKGQLISKTTNEALTWENRTSSHVFWAWTQPEAADGTSPIEMKEDYTGGTVHFGPVYDATKLPLDISSAPPPALSTISITVFP